MDAVRDEQRSVERFDGSNAGSARADAALARDPAAPPRRGEQTTLPMACKAISGAIRRGALVKGRAHDGVGAGACLPEQPGLGWATRALWVELCIELWMELWSCPRAFIVIRSTMPCDDVAIRRYDDTTTACSSQPTSLFSILSLCAPPLRTAPVVYPIPSASVCYPDPSPGILTLFTLFTHNAGPEDFCCLQPRCQRALERPHRPQGRFLAHRQSEGAFCLSVHRCVGEASTWGREHKRCSAGEWRPRMGRVVRAGLDYRRTCLRACSPAPALPGRRPAWDVGEGIFCVHSRQ